MKLLNMDDNIVNIGLNVILALNILVVLLNVFKSSILGGIVNFLILPLPAILLLILIWNPLLLSASL